MEYLYLNNIGPNYFHASDYSPHLLITFANILDLDQDQHDVGPDLDLDCLTF